MPSRETAVGADMGGTWLRVVALDERGRVLRRARVPAVKPRDLAAGVGAVLRGWRVAPAAVEAASTGLWEPALKARVAAEFRRFSPRVSVLSDLELAWRASLRGLPGVLVLAGTGAVAFGRDARGRRARAGGLGALLGDDGSAFWIGREWLRLGPEAVALRYARRPDAVRAVAALAPKVLARAKGDRAAARIVSEAQEAVAAYARAVARELRLERPVRWARHGALLEAPSFRKGVERRLGPGWTAVEPVETPELSAARAALLSWRSST